MSNSRGFNIALAAARSGKSMMVLQEAYDALGINPCAVPYYEPIYTEVGKWRFIDKWSEPIKLTHEHPKYHHNVLQNKCVYCAKAPPKSIQVLMKLQKFKRN